MKLFGRVAMSVGLALLYASAFFFPRVGSQAVYWLPIVGTQVLYPSAIAVIVLVPAALCFSAIHQPSMRARLASVLIVACLCWTAFLGFFTVAGFSALDAAEALTDRAEVVEARWIRIAIVILSLGSLVFFALRLSKSWGRTLRFLSFLGYMFTALTLVRVSNYVHGIFGIPGNRTLVSDNHTVSSTSLGMTKPRQVVWIIMDELDFTETLGRSTAHGQSGPPLPNLSTLAKVGVLATNAYPPARDTIASIPALLTGYPPAMLKFNNAGLILKTLEFGDKPFMQTDSIFSRLPEGPRSAAILGFYHPYCTVFSSVAPCMSFPKDNVGRWYDALTVFAQPLVASSRWIPGFGSLLPNSVYRAFEPMYRITDETLAAYPKFLSLEDKALIFIHMNLPHTPGDYTQRKFGVTTAGDDHTSYRRNLILVDQLIGQAVAVLTARQGGHDILLIVSSDHWLRIDSPRVPRRIPWIAWHLGESDGRIVSDRISTINTGALIISFLSGQIESQSQIAHWWVGKPNYPTLMPHGYSYE